jgi:colanic acid/amylovoran biosynthesis glycosyltransferase
MKVIEIIDIFPKVSETFILREILAMQKKGVDIEVFAFKGSNESTIHHEVSDVRDVKYFPKTTFMHKIYAHLYWFFHRPFSYLKTAAFAMNPHHGIIRLFSENLYDAIIIYNQKPDHIHAHWLKSSDFAMLIHLLTGISYTFTTHRAEIFDTPSKNYKIKSKLAKKHITVTEYNRQYIIHQFGVDKEDITVIHSALDFTKDYPIADSKGKNTIVSIARLEKVKNLDTLIYACSTLKKKKFDFECLIAGEGSEKGYLEELIKNLNLSHEVKLLGYRTQDEIIELLSRAKLLVLSSRSEGWPNVFTEAWACKVPVIGPNVTGIPDILQDGEDGFLVEPDDIDMLVERIEIMFTNESLRKKFIEKGYQKAFEDFNINLESNKLLQIWKE